VRVLHLSKEIRSALRLYFEPFNTLWFGATVFGAAHENTPPVRLPAICHPFGIQGGAALLLRVPDLDVCAFPK